MQAHRVRQLWGGIRATARLIIRKYAYEPAENIAKLHRSSVALQNKVGNEIEGASTSNQTSFSPMAGLFS